MRRYNYLLFDADNTIWDFNASQVHAFEQSFHDFGIPYQDAYLEVYKEINHRCWRQFEQGLISQDKLRTLRMELLFTKLGFEEDFEIFTQSYQNNLCKTDFMVDEAYGLLDTLQGSFELILITNGLKEIQRARIQNTGIDKYFKTIVISDEIGVAKPQAGFFDYTFEQINHPNKEEVLVIGDTLGSDIKGGKDYGLDTCWYNPHQKEVDKEIEATYNIQKLVDILSIVKSNLLSI